MITGSLVSSIQGEPGATHDIDILVNLNPADIPALIKAFMPRDYYLSESAIEEAIQHKSMFNLLDTNEGDKIDFWMLINEPFDQSFARKYKEKILGFLMNISSPEDTILMKLQWTTIRRKRKTVYRCLRVYEIQYGRLDYLWRNGRKL